MEGPSLLGVVAGCVRAIAAASFFASASNSVFDREGTHDRDARDTSFGMPDRRHRRRTPGSQRRRADERRSAEHRAVGRRAHKSARGHPRRGDLRRRQRRRHRRPDPRRRARRHPSRLRDPPARTTRPPAHGRPLGRRARGHRRSAFEMGVRDGRRPATSARRHRRPARRDRQRRGGPRDRVAVPAHRLERGSRWACTQGGVLALHAHCPPRVRSTPRRT